tara:strand:+ start:498 stop:929 length:432 start_codon:yes stop_codon:yes gene_type:complete
MRRWVWLLPLVFLQACAGTPLAEQLEQSFTTLDGEPQPESVPSLSDQPDTAVPAIQLAPADEPVESSRRDSEQGDANLVVEAKPPESMPSQPVRPVPRQPLAPYRITIRLAGADPAAPAEAVTQALRSSAVDFMVERIERVVP